MFGSIGGNRAASWVPPKMSPGDFWGRCGELWGCCQHWLLSLTITHPAGSSEGEDGGLFPSLPPLGLCSCGGSYSRAAENDPSITPGLEGTGNYSLEKNSWEKALLGAMEIFSFHSVFLKE